MKNNKIPGEKPLIVLGVTGGIAAYKAAELVSQLTQNGYEVQVIMTANALKLVGEITFRTLSRNPVITDLWSCAGEWKPRHVDLAQQADLFVVAPATVNFIGKFAGGIADDALTTFAVTMDCPVLVAPAMNPAMFAKAVVQENVAKLKQRGIHFIGPEEGHVACGAEGRGRMSEVPQILEAIRKLLA